MGLWKKISKISGYTPFTGFGVLNESFSKSGGGTPAGSVAGAVGYQTPAAKGEAQAMSDKARAEAEAAAKQAEFEASMRAGLERLAQKRKRGFGASMIVNPTLGSTSTLGS